VRWPDCETTRFSPPAVYDPHESFVYWVDEDMQAETRAARRAGKAFPESTRIVDDYRLKPAPEPASENPASNDKTEDP
jgi:hypothetical protein